MNKVEKIAQILGFPFVVYEGDGGVRAINGTNEKAAGVETFEFPDDSNLDDLSVWPQYLHDAKEVIIEFEGEDDEVLVF